MYVQKGGKQLLGPTLLIIIPSIVLISNGIIAITIAFL